MEYPSSDLQFTGDASAIRAVTFDATGTLFHAPQLGEIYSNVLARHGIEVAADEARRLIHLVWEEYECSSDSSIDRFRAHPQGAQGWWRRFLERVGEHLDVGPVSAFAAAELFDRFGQADSWTVFEEVPEVLERLAGRGLELGVVSNWDHRLPRLLDRLGLADWLRVVSYSEAIGVEKPHPEIFRDCLVRLDVDAVATLHVGDRVRHDVEGAVAVGMQVILVDREGRRETKDGLRDLRGLLSILGLSA